MTASSGMLKIILDNRSTSENLLVVIVHESGIRSRVFAHAVGLFSRFFDIVGGVMSRAFER